MILIALLKYFFFLLILFTYLVHHTAISLLLQDEKKRHRYFLKSTTGYASVIKKLLQIEVIADRPGREVTGSLIVANHMSYVDVLILAVAYPSLFVTSVEMREVPVLGWVTRLAGCFFVERRRSRITPDTKVRELGLMKKKISEGFNVFLFPEGTSSDGTQVLPFKVTFFQLAADAGIPVVPVCLRYKNDSGAIVPWYGEMTFPDHLWKLCKLSKIEVELRELPELRSESKFELSERSFEAIRMCYG